MRDIPKRKGRFEYTFSDSTLFVFRQFTSYLISILNQLQIFLPTSCHTLSISQYCRAIYVTHSYHHLITTIISIIALPSDEMGNRSKSHLLFTVNGFEASSTQYRRAPKQWKDGLHYYGADGWQNSRETPVIESRGQWNAMKTRDVWDPSIRRGLNATELAMQQRWEATNSKSVLTNTSRLYTVNGYEANFQLHTACIKKWDEGKQWYGGTTWETSRERPVVRKANAWTP